jgi:hypothetical protein
MQLTAAGRVWANLVIACTLAVGVLALTASGAQAAPAALTNHPISGIESAISCLTAARCVAVGFGARGAKNHADVVALVNGKQGHISVVAASQQLYSVSCPSSAGCWALGPQNSGANLVFVQIGPTGKVTKTTEVSDPSGASIARLSCVSMTSCAVLTNNIFVTPAAIEIGTWTGTQLTLHKVAGLQGSTATVGEGISCWQTSCLAVGYYELSGGKPTGFLLTMNRGQPGPQHFASGDFFFGVSCVSSAKCYAAGFLGHASGIVVTVANGIAGHTQHEAADPFGIECVGRTCRSSGEELRGLSFYGVIVTLSNGSNRGRPVVDKAIGGFDGPNAVAKRGTGFAAVGPAAKGGGSVVAIG